MEDGELVYIKENVSERQAEWLEEMGIKEKQNIIPIYTEKQFRKIGTGEEIEIEEVGGEKFKFNIDSHYILQNDIDLKCSKENQWIPIGTVNKPFDGILEDKTETNIIELLNKEEEKYKEDIESQNKGYPIFK